MSLCFKKDPRYYYPWCRFVNGVLDHGLIYCLRHSPIVCSASMPCTPRQGRFSTYPIESKDKVLYAAFLYSFELLSIFTLVLVRWFMFSCLPPFQREWGGREGSLGASFTYLRMVLRIEPFGSDPTKSYCLPTFFSNKNYVLQVFVSFYYFVCYTVVWLGILSFKFSC